MNILQPNRMAAAILTGTDTAQGTSFAIPRPRDRSQPQPGLVGYPTDSGHHSTEGERSDDRPFWSGAPHWNGGGMHISHDYGFGDVDARTVNKTVFYVRAVT